MSIECGNCEQDLRSGHSPNCRNVAETARKSTALVIRIKGRYFRGFGKAGQLQTSWSLAGAKLFLEDHFALPDAQKKLAKKGLEGKYTLSAVKEQS
jgi:hypothetical protein